jgi:serine phosphatase RsbU (regulator of sigma subunit)/anti-sigma regulatory factor (Ser/Thr protein kinase)
VLAATVFDTYFAGQLQALSAIAASPAVTAADATAMRAYFAHFRPDSGTAFTAGIGWIDRAGRQQAASDPRARAGISLGDRPYFKDVIATRKPVVAEAIVAERTRRRLLVMAVPTRDAGGRLSGVLAGGIVLRPSSSDSRANDLGYAGLNVIDRKGQQIGRRDLARPGNGEVLAQLRKRKEGVLVDATGLDASDGRVIGFATSATPGWTVVLDQPASAVFADARNALVRELLLIGAALMALLMFFAWALRRTRRGITANRAQVARWSRLTRSLNKAAKAQDIQEALLEALSDQNPSAVAVVAVASDGNSRPTTAARSRRRGSAEPVPHALVVQLGELLTVADGTVVLRGPEDVQRALGATGSPIASAYGLPLRYRDGRSAGAAAVLSLRRHKPDSNELALLEAYADQALQALERVRRHQDEHDAAVLLQQSLLPERLPAAPGLEVATHYRSGALNTNVGGDWYDVVARPDGIVHLTVGDVAGRGLYAAIAMGRLRNAFRAYALEYTSPSEIIERLSRHLSTDEMATMACFTYDPCTRVLTHASAGHPPALLLQQSTRDVALLDGSPRGPLGWRATVLQADEQIERIPPNATLALYTDGLVERRGVSIDDGIQRLATALQNADLRDLATSADSVVAEVMPDVADDIALLLVTFTPTPDSIDLTIPAQPAELQPLRHRVQHWLEDQGIEDATKRNAILALNEACANSIEHAYRDSQPGTVEIRLRHHEHELMIVVEDHGIWLERVSNPERGRGILLMQRLMGTAQIERRPHGTRVVLETTL